MPTARITLSTPTPPAHNPLPSLLHTASGTALIELQGTFNLPPPPGNVNTSEGDATVEIGRVIFPGSGGGMPDLSTCPEVYLQVGRHQRLAGKTVKLTKPFAVLRRKKGDVVMGGVDGGEVGDDELEIVDVVRYKMIFSSRPEPVT